MQPLDAIFSKPEQRLLNAVLVHADRDFGTLELLKLMGNGRGGGSKVLERWVGSGLLRERRVGNQRRFSANPQFVLYPELRLMVLKTVGLVEPLAAALAPLSRHIEEAFVFGSIAAGTDTSQSDIDLAIVGDVGLFDVSSLLDTVQGELGRAVHVSVYSAADAPVLRAIRNGPRIDILEKIRAKAA